MKRKMKFFSVAALACLGISFISCSDDSPKACVCDSVTHFTGSGSEYLDDVTTTTTATIGEGSCSDLNSTTSSSSMGLTGTTTITCHEK